MLPPLFRFTPVRVLLALLFLSAASFGASKGVLIYKDQTWQADEFAQAVEYDELEEFPNIFNLTTAHEGKVSVLTGQIVKNIRYLDPAALTELVEPHDLTRLTSSINELSSAARKYPKSAKFFEPHIRQLQEIVDRFHKGEVIMNGAWLPSKEAAMKLKKEHEAAIAAAEAEDIRQAEALRVAKEKRAAEAHARELEQRELLAKESLRKEEESKAAEDKRKLLEESQAAEAHRKEEQQRIAQEKQALEGRRIEYASRKMRDADRFTEEFDLPVSTESANTISVVKLPEESGQQRPEDRAVNAAETIVRKQLRAPLTARFEDARMLQEADPWYQVFITVDAQNAFGVYIRGTYVCTLKLGAGDEFSYDPSRGLQKMDEAAIQRDGVLSEIRAACGWRANQER